MTSKRFSTLAMPSEQQFAAWCGWFEPLFDVAPPAGGLGAGFAGEAHLWSVGRAAIGRVQAPRLHAKRGTRNLRRDPVDHWNITVGQVETKLTRAGNAVIVPAGTPFVVSLGEPVESEREADTRLQLYLPRDQFAALAPVLDRARHMPLGGATGRLLADYLRLLERSLPDLSAEDLARLANPIEAMIAACLAPCASAMRQAAAQVEFTRMEQIRKAIRRRLHSATLNAASLCRDVGMSRSQLYRLLEGAGGVAHYIQHLRLLAAYGALSDVEDKRSIAAIAEAFGFYDASTFSRAFRRHFGITPSDLRVEARSGGAPTPVHRPVMAADALTLTSYLRRI